MCAVQGSPAKVKGTGIYMSTLWFFHASCIMDIIIAMACEQNLFNELKILIILSSYWIYYQSRMREPRSIDFLKVINDFVNIKAIYR